MVPRGNKGQPGIPGDKVQYICTQNMGLVYIHMYVHTLVMVIYWPRFAS